MKKYLIILLIICLVVFAACTSDVDNGSDKEIVDNEKMEDNEEIVEDDELIEEDEPIEIDYETVKPYEVGHIMVVMYHGIIDNPPYHRTEEDFRKDLQYMYDNGYRLISVRDYLDNNIDIEAGKTPIVLTFDDSLSTTYSLIEEDGKLVPKEGTAVAILEDFASKNPDFGKTATFYTHVGSQIFDGAGTVEERLNWLIDNGYELGNHSATHADLSVLDEKGLSEEIGKVDELIKDIIPNYTVDSITFPFGKRPQEHLMNILRDGKYEGHKFSYIVGFREGPSGSLVSPFHVNFDPFNAPRVRGSEGADGDLWWYFNYYDNEHPDYKYVSDGNPDRISVPEEYENKVNKNKLGDKELYLY